MAPELAPSCWAIDGASSLQAPIALVGPPACSAPMSCVRSLSWNPAAITRLLSVSVSVCVLLSAATATPTAKVAITTATPIPKFTSRIFAVPIAYVGSHSDRPSSRVTPKPTIFTIMNVRSLTRWAIGGLCVVGIAGRGVMRRLYLEPPCTEPFCRMRVRRAGDTLAMDARVDRGREAIFVERLDVEALADFAAEFAGEGTRAARGRSPLRSLEYAGKFHPYALVRKTGRSILPV